MMKDPVTDRQMESMRGGRRCSRAIGWVLISGVVTAITVVTSAPVAAGGDHTLLACGEISPAGECRDQTGTRFIAVAPPPTATTTTVTPVIALPMSTTTTTSTTPVISRPTSTTTTTTPVIAQQPPPTTTQPSVPVATTTTTPVIAQQPPPTTTIPSNLAVSTTAPGVPEELATGTTVPPTSGEPIALGELSTDPEDWSEEVQQYLQAEGFDLEALASQSASDAGPSDQLLSNEGCAVNCITSGLAYAVGVGAYLEVTTSVPAFIQIEILDVGLKFGPPSEKVWGATWPHLQPNTTYQAVARAHDAQGNMAVASGSFTTLARFATITFQPTVFWFGNVPDFDPWQNYDWHHHAEAYLNGLEQVSGSGTAPALEFDTGVAQSSVIEIIYVGMYHAHGVDCGDFDEPLWSGGGPPPVSGGDDNCDAWFGAVANGVQLDGYPVNSTSWTGHEFTFPLSTFWGEQVGPPVYLTVDVTVQVWYQKP